MQGKCCQQIKSPPIVTSAQTLCHYSSVGCHSAQTTIKWLYIFSVRKEVERMTSMSLNIVTANTVRGILVCLLLVLYRLTLPRVSVGPDSISVSLHPLFPGTDILQGASGGVRCHYRDQVMSQLFHSSCSFIQQPITEMLRGAGIRLTCQVWSLYQNVD